MFPTCKQGIRTTSEAGTDRTTCTESATNVWRTRAYICRRLALSVRCGSKCIKRALYTYCCCRSDLRKGRALLSASVPASKRRKQRPKRRNFYKHNQPCYSIRSIRKQNTVFLDTAVVFCFGYLGTQLYIRVVILVSIKLEHEEGN